MAVIGLTAEVLDEPGGVGASGELGGEDDQLLALPQGGLQEGEGLLQVAPYLSGGIGPEGHVGLEVGLQEVKGGGAVGGGGFLQAGEEVLPPPLKKVGPGTLDELYAAIGYGGMTAQKAVNRIRDELRQQARDKNEKANAERLAAQAGSPQLSAPAKLIPGARRSESGIIVEGLDNCLVKFAKCCAPVPGDPVVGFITRGFGVSVHRQDCPNASPEKQQEEPGRWVKVAWGESELPGYQTSLELSAKDREGLALDITMALTTAKVKVHNFSVRSLPDGYARGFIVLEVKDRNELTSVTNKLSQISGVYQVKRASG